MDALVLTGKYGAINMTDTKKGLLCDQVIVISLHTTRRKNVQPTNDYRW